MTCEAYYSSSSVDANCNDNCNYASDADCDSQVCTRNPSSVETLPRFECVGVCVR